MSNFTAAERLESLKAAAIGGGTAACIGLGLLVARRLEAMGDWGLMLSGLGGLTLGIALAIATLSGALFALTYRYAVRRDANPQLKAGVVLAFALVRGLAEVDAASAIAQRYWPLLSAIGENLLLFGGTGWVMAVAIGRGWVRPFGE